jgi:hypothetical protein
LDKNIPRIRHFNQAGVAFDAWFPSPQIFNPNPGSMTLPGWLYPTFLRSLGQIRQNSEAMPRVLPFF